MGQRSLTALWMCAVLVALGASATAASAEPQFLTKAVVGEATSSVPLTGTVGASFWEGKTSKAKITCTGGTLSGEVTGAQSVAKTLLVLTGCESSGCKVNSKGHPEGEVVSQALAGKLNGIKSTLPGLKLFSEAEGKGGTLIQWEICGAVLGNLTGEVTGSLSGASGESAATGKLVSSLKLTFAESGGAQKYQGFSEGPEAGLMGQLTDTVNGTPELAGLSMIQTDKTVPATFGIGVTK